MIQVAEMWATLKSNANLCQVGSLRWPPESIPEDFDLNMGEGDESLLRKLLLPQRGQGSVGIPRGQQKLIRMEGPNLGSPHL